MGETYRVMEHPILEELREPDTYIIYDGKKFRQCRENRWQRLFWQQVYAL